MSYVTSTNYLLSCTFHLPTLKVLDENGEFGFFTVPTTIESNENTDSLASPGPLCTGNTLFSLSLQTRPPHASHIPLAEGISPPHVSPMRRGPLQGEDTQPAADSAGTEGEDANTENSDSGDHDSTLITLHSPEPVSMSSRAIHGKSSFSSSSLPFETSPAELLSRPKSGVLGTCGYHGHYGHEQSPDWNNRAYVKTCDGVGEGGHGGEGMGSASSESGWRSALVTKQSVHSPREQTQKQKQKPHTPLRTMASIPSIAMEDVAADWKAALRTKKGIHSLSNILVCK